MKRQTKPFVLEIKRSRRLGQPGEDSRPSLGLDRLAEVSEPKSGRMADAERIFQRVEAPKAASADAAGKEATAKDAAAKPMRERRILQSLLPPVVEQPTPAVIGREEGADDAVAVPRRPGRPRGRPKSVEPPAAAVQRQSSASVKPAQAPPAPAQPRARTEPVARPVQPPPRAPEPHVAEAEADADSRKQRRPAPDPRNLPRGQRWKRRLRLSLVTHNRSVPVPG